MSISITSQGNFNKTESLLLRIKRKDYYEKLDSYAKKGVEALKAATPKDTGLTAASWDYTITTDSKSTTITWTNDRFIDGYYYGSSGKTPLVFLIVYGHATQKGHFIPPNDFVTPAIKNILNDISKNTWAEVIDR